jgi:hypothetical protein
MRYGQPAGPAVRSCLVSGDVRHRGRRRLLGSLVRAESQPAAVVSPEQLHTGPCDADAVVGVRSPRAVLQPTASVPTARHSERSRHPRPPGTEAGRHLVTVSTVRWSPVCRRRDRPPTVRRGPATASATVSQRAYPLHQRAPGHEPEYATDCGLPHVKHFAEGGHSVIACPSRSVPGTTRLPGAAALRSLDG